MISMHQAHNLFHTRPAATLLNSPRLRLQPSKRARPSAPSARVARIAGNLLASDPCSASQASANAKMLQQAFATSWWMGKDARAVGLWEKISQMPPGLDRELCEAVFGASAIAACKRRPS